MPSVRASFECPPARRIRPSVAGQLRRSPFRQHPSPTAHASPVSYVVDVPIPPDVELIGWLQCGMREENLVESGYDDEAFAEVLAAYVNDDGLR